MPQQHYYPRRMRVVDKEEKQIIKRLVITVGLIIALGLAVIFGGIPALLSVGNFFTNKTPQASTQPQTPVLTPRLDPMVDATNSGKITVSGSGQDGATVSLYMNGQLYGEKPVSSDQTFSFPNVPLKEGQNTIWTQQKENGQLSHLSDEHDITYDTQPPTLTVNAPQDNQTINGGSNTLQVTGKTDPNVSVTVNDAIATVGSDGSFTTTIQLNSGSQTIKVIATDVAGNQTTVQRTVTFNP